MRILTGESEVAATRKEESNARKRHEYAVIEPGWRAGIKSLAQLAYDYYEATGRRITAQSVHNHFTKRGIPRDLSHRIRKQAGEIVSRSAESVTTVTEEQIVDGSARYMAEVLIGHRRDLAKMRNRVRAMADELDGSGEDIVRRSMVLKQLVDAQIKLISSEREALGVDRDQPQDTGLSGESVEVLLRIKASIMGNGKLLPPANA